MDSIQKIASETPAVLLEGARLTKKLAKDNIDLLEQNEALTRDLTIHKLAMRMHERGLEPALSLEEKIAMLRSVEPTKLAGIEAAVEMQPGGFKLATLHIEEEVSSRDTSSSKSPGELGSSAHYERLDEKIRSL